MSATPPLCDFGKKIIDFNLPGIDGKKYNINSVKGSNGLVVAFICNHCPYVKAVIDRMVVDASTLAKEGIGFVAINSNDASSYPEDSFDNMKKFAEDHKLNFPYLYDESQDVARAYEAVCTPDFFGYNEHLELQYRGRLDESRKMSGPANARRELVEAMSLVAKTGRGPKEQFPSMGCSIKWKI